MASASDAFNRTGADPLDGSWTTYTGGLRIVSNAVRSNGSAWGNLAGYTGVSWTGDHYSQITITTLHANDITRAHGPAVRCQTVASERYGYALKICATDSKVVLQGASTTITDIGATDTTDWVAGDVAKLEIVGTTINVYRNAGLLYSRTDSTLSGGVPGLHSNSSTYAMDDWSGADIATGGIGLADLRGIGCGGMQQLNGGMR